MLLLGGWMVGANFIIAYFSEWRFCNTRILVYGVLACGFFFHSLVLVYLGGMEYF